MRGIKTKKAPVFKYFLALEFTHFNKQNREQKFTSLNTKDTGLGSKMGNSPDKDRENIGSVLQENIESEAELAHPSGIAYTQTRHHKIDRELMLQRRVVALQKHNFESDVFRLLRTKVLKQLRDNDWNSFAVTAPTQGAGKTMVAVNLAIAIAMEQNQTVLLVDLDLRYPRVHWYFDMPVEYGLRDYLIADKPLSDILIHPGIDRLVILPGKGQATGSSEILSTPRMRDLVNEIKNRYQSRIVIFDLPPVLSADDVLISMDYYDAALLVVEEGRNNPDEVRKALQLLSAKQLLGTVLNKSESPLEHQYYY